MMESCFACGHKLPRNDDLECLPTGSMVAFDARLGRLWVVCRWCSHWSLVPIEHRWEAVEELERRSERGAVLASTDAVSLLQIGSVRAVRVGSAPIAEETWWRYGPTLRGRSRRYAMVSSVGGALAAGASVTGLLLLAAVPGMIEIAAFRRFKVTQVPGSARRRGADLAANFDRRFRFGRYAWHGSASCESCGSVLDHLAFKDRHIAMMRSDGSVAVRCSRCGKSEPGHVIVGQNAADLVRRCLSYTNVAGATQAELTAGLGLIRRGEITPSSYSGPLTLQSVPPEQRVALELLATERYEAAALRSEVRELEARWRSAESIAVIVDNELT